MVLYKNEPVSELPEDEASRKRLATSKVLTEIDLILTNVDGMIFIGPILTSFGPHWDPILTPY